MSLVRCSSGVSSRSLALTTEYSQTLPSLRSMRRVSSTDWLKSGVSAMDPSGYASMVISTCSRSASGEFLNAGCAAGSDSGPQSAQMTNVEGSVPARRLRPCASSVRSRVASRPDAFFARTLCEGVPKTARNKPFHRSPADVVTVRSASLSSANESADTYV